MDSDRERAEALHDTGMELEETGHEGAAIEQYLAALALDPERPTTLYNLGLIYKYRREWRASFDYNVLARALNPEDDATQWNLAIAATALQDWVTARDVWRSLDILPHSNEGLIDGNFGHTPARLNADENAGKPAEVVWAKRLCPVRARILNIPTGATGFRYGDVVLHDGAPVGYRPDADGKEVPVFNVLELFEPSRFSTFEASVEVEGPSDVDALAQACGHAEVTFEHWTSTIRNLCKACSEGRPHKGHDHELTESGEWERMRRVGFAAKGSEPLNAIFKGWVGPRRRLVDFQCTLNARLITS